MSYRKHLIFLFTILILTTHSVKAEVKIGVVKLDILFKEIPIFKLVYIKKKSLSNFDDKINILSPI